MILKGTFWSKLGIFAQLDRGRFGQNWSNLVIFASYGREDGLGHFYQICPELANSGGCQVYSGQIW